VLEGMLDSAAENVARETAATPVRSSVPTGQA